MAPPKPDVPAGRLLLGVVGAPHGVRGEVRLKSFTADPKAIAGYGPLLVGHGPATLRIEAARHLKDDMLVVRLSGVATREAAAALTGAALSVERAALPPPGEEEFYDADLIGLPIETETGTPVGRLAAIVNYGAGDILEIARPEGSLLVAFTRAFVPVVDVRGGRIAIAEAALMADGDNDAPPPEAR